MARTLGECRERTTSATLSDPSRRCLALHFSLTSWSRLALLSVLMVVYALPAPWSTIITDTARDFIESAPLLSGSLPLRGPEIVGAFNLGPVWYLTIALAIALTGSVAATLTLAALLAALKFPLAYLCGRHLVDARFGLIWALALAVPGMANFTQLVITHTAMVEAATLAWLYVSIRIAERGHPAWWLAFGAAASLALHAHPTTMLLAPIALWLVVRRRAWNGELGWLLAGLAVALLPLLPMLIAEAAEGWPALQRSAAYAGQRSGQPGLAGVAPLYLGLGLNAPRFIVDGLLSDDLRPLGWLLYALLAISAVAGGWLALRQPGNRRFLLATTALVLALPLAVMLLREVTPYYMLLVWRVFAALLVAQCWYALLRVIALVGRQAAASAIAVFVASVLLLHALTAAMWIRRAEAGLALLPIATVADARVSARVTQTANLLPAWRLEAAADDLCDDPIVLHAGLAQLVAAAVELPRRRSCPAADGIRYGGGGDLPMSRHRLGLSPQELRRIGFRDADWPLALALRPLDVPVEGAGLQVGFVETYPYFDLPSGRSSWRFEFRTDSDARVVVAVPLGIIDRSRLLSVQVDDRPAPPLSVTRTVSVYHCPHCRGEAVWRIEGEAASAAQIDITLAPTPPRSP